MKKFRTLATLIGILAALAGFWACQLANPTGTVRLSITDAAVDDPNIDGVWLTIREVQYNLGGDDDAWLSFAEFAPPLPVNLLDYQNGVSLPLGDLEIPSGQYNQVRFLLDIPEESDETPPGTPGCWVSFSDDREDAPLFVPSGAQTGYKAVGSFQVPVNGTVDITADFDLHKSLRLSKNGKRYLLQPTIRLVVDSQAGSIAGPVANLPAEQAVKVFAYADGTYTDAEDDTPLPGEAQFPNSAASAAVDPLNRCYRIAFLAAGVYDLVVASLNPDTTLTALGFAAGVAVESGQTTHQAIDLQVLDPSP